MNIKFDTNVDIFIVFLALMVLYSSRPVMGTRLSTLSVVCGIKYLQEN